MSPSGLEAEIAVDLGRFDVDLGLEAAPGEVVALLGPNGAGKTTVLRALAGLQPLDRGRIVLGGAVLEDTARRIRIPAERRPVGVVFQDYLLFPHLSALDNVAYGLRSRGAGRADARRTAGTWLERVGLASLAAARSGSLSGGEQQRVALARALATDPRLLLLDEPLAALDASTRTRLRRDLAGHLRSFQGVLIMITHDPLEAVALADRLVVLEGGRVTQTGLTADVAARPKSGYVADLVGLNLLRGTAREQEIELAGGGRLVTAHTASGPVFVTIAPHSVSVWKARPGDGSPRNIWSGVTSGIELQGDRVRLTIEGQPRIVAEITPAAMADLRLQAGVGVWVSVKAGDVEVYPA